MQRKGEFVVTNLLTAAEFERCIPGYKAFRGQPGSTAELENLYVSTLRLEDVLDHFIAADRGEVELDLPRAIDVLSGVAPRPPFPRATAVIDERHFVSFVGSLVFCRFGIISVEQASDC